MLTSRLLNLLNEYIFEDNDYKESDNSFLMNKFLKIITIKKVIIDHNLKNNKRIT